MRYYFPLDAEYVVHPAWYANTPVKIAPFEVRLPMKAGPHTVGVTFPKESLKLESMEHVDCAAFHVSSSEKTSRASSASVDLWATERVKRFARPTTAFRRQ